MVYGVEVKSAISDNTRNARILVVDGEENLRQGFGEMLGYAGFKAEMAEDFAAAEKCLLDRSFDVVFIDTLVPEMDGIGLLKTIKEIQPDTQVIMVTGSASVDTTLEAVRTDAYDFLTKPVTQQVLILMAERAVETKRLKDENRRLEEENRIYRENIEKMIEERNHKPAEMELKRRNEILEAVRFASDAFLRSAAWEDNINEVLDRLGHAADVSRVNIFENCRDENNRLLMSRRYEWVAPGIKPEIENPELVKFPYGDGGFGRWEETLGQARLIKGHVRDFPKAEQEVLNSQNILSVVIVPIFVEEQWWGFIGFDECFVEHDWSSPEIEGLKVAAGTLGAAIHSEQQGMERVRLVTAIEQSTESIIITDPEGIIQYVNPTFETISGYKKDEVVGQNPKLLKSGRQDDWFYREMWETIENGNVWFGHFINKKKDGGLFEEEATISPVRSAEGKTMNYVAIKRDVTEKRRLESLAEAANLMENIGYVFSGIRHELGNPINSIKMTLTVLNASLETFDRETVQEFLERSLNEVARVEYLLKALRNFSMFETPRVQSLRIDTFLEKFLSLVADDFKRKGIKIETLSSTVAMKGLVDPRALQQVMLNLMTNAADSLSGRKNPRIDLDFSKTGGWIHVKVIDNGCGMSPQQKADLFKPFLTSKPGGTGLGLVIVKKMLSEMNCTIDVDSRMDVGTTVTISIPRGIN